MYYHEEIVNGILCFKLSPNGQLRPLSAEKLTERIVELKQKLSEAYQLFDEMEIVKN